MSLAINPVIGLPELFAIVCSYAARGTLYNLCLTSRWGFIHTVPYLWAVLPTPLPLLRLLPFFGMKDHRWTVLWEKVPRRLNAQAQDHAVWDRWIFYSKHTVDITILFPGYNAGPLYLSTQTFADLHRLKPPHMPYLLPRLRSVAVHTSLVYTLRLIEPLLTPNTRHLVIPGCMLVRSASRRLRRQIVATPLFSIRIFGYVESFALRNIRRVFSVVPIVELELDPMEPVNLSLVQFLSPFRMLKFLDLNATALDASTRFHSESFPHLLVLKIIASPQMALAVLNGTMQLKYIYLQLDGYWSIPAFDTLFAQLSYCARTLLGITMVAPRPTHSYCEFDLATVVPLFALRGLLGFRLSGGFRVRADEAVFRDVALNWPSLRVFVMPMPSQAITGSWIAALNEIATLPSLVELSLMPL